jgi:hypothetical protein
MAGIPQAKAKEAQRLEEEKARVEKVKASIFQVGANNDLASREAQESISAMASSVGIPYETALEIAQNGAKAAAASVKKAQEDQKVAAARLRRENLGKMFDAVKKPVVAEAVRNGSFTPDFAQQLYKETMGKKAQERQNKIPPELVDQLTELANTGDRTAIALLQDAVANDSERVIRAAYDYLEDVRKGREPTAKTPEQARDSGLTAAEQETYEAIVEENPKTFKPLLSGFGWWKSADSNRARMTYDEAERIRTNNPSLSKKAALEVALKIQKATEKGIPYTTIQQALKKDGINI